MRLPEPLSRLGAAIGRAFAAAPSSPPARGQLFGEQAVDAFLDGIIGSSDPDEVLRKIGRTRADLRILEGDDEISAALETRANAVLATSWRLEPSEGDVAQFVREQLEPIAEDLVFSSWRAVPYGYSVQEAVYQRTEAGRIGLARLVEKPFEWFEPRRNGELLYRPAGGFAQGVVVDQRFKFFLTTNRASYRNPRGEAILSRAYWPWFLRSAGWRFCARFLERHSAPLLVGKTAGKKDEMAAALASAVQSGAIAVGLQDTVEAVSAGNGGEAFDRFDERCNRRIQKLILGQTLTTEMGKGGGSFAAAKVHDGVRADRKVADLRMCRRTVQRVVDALVALNFPGQAAPVFTWDEGVDLATDRAERDAKLATAKVVKFTEQYLLDRYDFEPGDFEIPATVAPPPLPGQGEGDDEGGAVPPQFAAAYRFATAANRARFTPAQEAVEALGDVAMARSGSPIDPAKIRNAILHASSPDDLVERLARLYDEEPPEQFREILERAIFAADVLGYAHAQQQQLGQADDGGES
jgi:phage gp29-like protein